MNGGECEKWSALSDSTPLKVSPDFIPLNGICWTDENGVEDSSRVQVDSFCVRCGERFSESNPQMGSDPNDPCLSCFSQAVDNAHERSKDS